MPGVRLLPISYFLFSDALVVGAPVEDGLLDLLAVKVLGDSALGEGDYFGVGGETQPDELVGGEGFDQAELIIIDEVGEAKLLL